MSDKESRRVALIRTRIEQALKPSLLQIHDDSAAHAGHAEAKASGGSHFNVIVASEAFVDKTAIQRHKMIYAALGDAMETEIHALSIKAYTPTEAATKVQNV